MFDFKKVILDLLFPVGCLNCGRDGYWLCDRCLDQIKINQSPAAMTIAVDSPLSGVWIAADYNDKILAAAIKSFKYQFLPDLGQRLAELQFKYLSGNPIFCSRHFDFIVPVPLSRRRLNWRGFNQSAILAAELCRRLNQPLAKNLLSRRYHTHPQVGLPAAERLSNVKGIFAANRAYCFAGAKILLIDDVVTSGATLGECAGTLLAAGAAEVWAAVIAHG